MRTVVGLFQNKTEARRTVDDLKRIGVREDDVSMLSTEGVKGPMAAYLEPSKKGGGDPGGILSALVRMGLSEIEAKRYVDGIQQGCTLETVAVEDARADDALEIMRAHALGPGAPTPRGIRDNERRGEHQSTEEVIPVIVEELSVGKREVPGAGIRAKTTVTSTPIEEEIEYRTENIDVETIRRTNVDVERIPYDAAAYRGHYMAEYGKTGGQFEHYEPAYRFGHERGHVDETGDWSKTEHEARFEWEAKHPNTWDRFKGAIRHAWEKTTG